MEKLASVIFGSLIGWCVGIFVLVFFVKEIFSFIDKLHRFVRRLFGLED